MRIALLHTITYVSDYLKIMLDGGKKEEEEEEEEGGSLKPEA